MHFPGLIPFFQTISRKKLFWALSKQDENIAIIIRNLLDDHDMISTDDSSLCATNKELESLMQKKIEESHGLSAEQANRIVPLHLAASLVELAYHECSFAEKLNIALLNWYLLYIDNQSPEDVTPFIAFQERFFKKSPQLDPLLDGLASCLHAVFDLYPIFFANSIVNSIFDSIVGTCTEPSIKLQPESTSALFPSFLRQRNGAGLAYALMMFPNSLQPVSYVVCFKVLADMDFWIASVNDILSYHKESVAGETTNYILNRANMEAKAQLTVASDIRKEVLHSRHYIYTTLSATVGQEAVKIWRTWERGFITWHLQQDRYMLRELPLGL